MKEKFDIYVADFETRTTGETEQSDTEVWAAALVKLDAPDETSSVLTFDGIEPFMRRLFSIKSNCKIFFHNLKFDGTFILDWLLTQPDFKTDGEDTEFGMTLNKRYKDKRGMPNKSFNYSISTKGLWYSITVKYANRVYIFQDSLKKLPFSVKKIGKDFQTKHQKLEMEYIGDRHAGYEMTPEEREYICNDVLVVKEALKIMYEEGYDKMTIGADCLAEYRKGISKDVWNTQFPNLYEIELDPERFGVDNVGDYIRNSYHGGWCYVVPEKAGKVFQRFENGQEVYKLTYGGAIGTTADVNSLYPSMMHSDSGNRYPVGKPTFWKGNFIPQQALAEDKYYFIRVKTRFYIKDGMLPTIQIKGNWLYNCREWLTSSDYKDKQGNTYRELDGENGEKIQIIPTLTLTMTDWKLLNEHYNLEDTEIMDGCFFYTRKGLFDDYINKFAEIKMHAKGARRQLAKLFLNNLYGKFATSTDSSYKVCFLNEDGELRTYDMTENDKKPGYIPIGSAITSYARNFTITAAQKNYHGTNARGFIYADTDSIHCDLTPDEIVGAPEDPVKFNHWKYESCWDEAIFTRQKTYIEHITHDNREPVETPHYDVKCAGMGKNPKELFVKSLTNNFEDYSEEELKNMHEDEIEFLKTKRTLLDFKVGLEVPGNLKNKHIKGGTLLIRGSYKMRPRLG